MEFMEKVMEKYGLRMEGWVAHDLEECVDWRFVRKISKQKKLSKQEKQRNIAEDILKNVAGEKGHIRILDYGTFAKKFGLSKNGMKFAKKRLNHRTISYSAKTQEIITSNNAFIVVGEWRKDADEVRRWLTENDEQYRFESLFGHTKENDERAIARINSEFEKVKMEIDNVDLLPLGLELFEAAYKQIEQMKMDLFEKQ